MSNLLAAIGFHPIWIVHRGGHPILFLAMLGVILTLLMTVILLAILHYGKK